MKVSVAEARNKFTQLIRQVESGERVTICRHGLPVIDMVPAAAEERKKPKLGTLVGKVRWDPHAFDPMTDEEVEAFVAGR